MTTYLKFPDEQTAIETLSAFRNEDGWINSSHTHAIDVVGAITKGTGVFVQTEMGDVEQSAPIDGFHINFVGDLPEAALPYVVEPANPVRVFA